MAVQGTVVTLTTSAVVAGDGLHGVIRVTLRNRGTGTVYLGGSDVTTAGFPLSTADEFVSLQLGVGETLYGTSTGAGSVGVIRTDGTT